MAIKNYMINDKWLDMAKQNIVEVESTDGVIGSVKVNGQEYGGGGGSSDFSTAEVILSISGNIGYPIILPLLLDGDFSALVASGIYESGTYTVAMYKGTSGGSLDLRILEDFSVNTSGDISYDESEGLITITGDCSITIS